MINIKYFKMSFISIALSSNLLAMEYQDVNYLKSEDENAKYLADFFQRHFDYFLSLDPYYSNVHALANSKSIKTEMSFLKEHPVPQGLNDDFYHCVDYAITPTAQRDRRSFPFNNFYQNLSSIGIAELETIASPNPLCDMLFVYQVDIQNFYELAIHALAQGYISEQQFAKMFPLNPAWNEKQIIQLLNRGANYEALEDFTGIPRKLIRFFFNHLVPYYSTEQNFRGYYGVGEYYDTFTNVFSREFGTHGH